VLERPRNANLLASRDQPNATPPAKPVRARSDSDADMPTTPIEFSEEFQKPVVARIEMTSKVRQLTFERIDARD
jgi:hypothetical protein